MGADDEDNPQQTDLSHLRIQEMTPQQRAELRRRYSDFVRHFDGTPPPPSARHNAPSGKRLRQWTPGAKG